MWVGEVELLFVFFLLYCVILFFVVLFFIVAVRAVRCFFWIVVGCLGCLGICWFRFDFGWL